MVGKQQLMCVTVTIDLMKSSLYAATDATDMRSRYANAKLTVMFQSIFQVRLEVNIHVKLRYNTVSVPCDAIW